MAKGDKWTCDSCGYVYNLMEPIGICKGCKQFSSYSLVKPVASALPGIKAKAATPGVRPTALNELSSAKVKRSPTGIGELDRVLGGGFVQGQVILLSGSPGAGKSSLSLAVANSFAKDGGPVLYASGEESVHQIGLRAKRLGVDSPNIHVVNETSLETLLGHIEQLKPSFLIVDSLQTLASSEIKGSLGSVSQSKEAAHVLTNLAKTRALSMILVSQVVKSGDFSGSESIQHIVDATLTLDSDKNSPLKFLRASKNRFANTTEVGVFMHSERGLVEVKDPSGVLIDENDGVETSGVAMSFISEGVRAIPVEIQALVAETGAANPRRQFSGVSYNRGQIVCAILDKFCHTRLYNYDVFLNTMSGVKVGDPTSDLACAAAILMSAKNLCLQQKTAFIGELSLTGQVRGSFMIENKVREAKRLGFETAVIPKQALNSINRGQIKGINLVGVSHVSSLLSSVPTKQISQDI